MTPSQGLIQIYTGNGKGKTTAAIGLAVRALGHGRRVLLARFLKPAEPASGEVILLSGLPGIDILTSGMGIINGTPDPEAVTAGVARTFDQARERILAGEVDLAIFDEINNTLRHGYLPLAEVIDLCHRRPAATELVFTGRHAPEELLAEADLITRMEPVRHPLSAGIAARQGIEY